MEFQTAKGVRDLPPEDKFIKNEVVEQINRATALAGFAPLEVPTIERFETLAAKYGAGAESDVLKETFLLTDQGGRKLGLRFEFTTSLARYVAQNPTLKLPFKVFQVGSNFRDGPLKLGRYREFWQADADIVGSSSMLCEVDLLLLVEDVFADLGLEILIKINNRKILNGILRQAGVTDVREALIAIDKLEKIGRKGVEEELRSRGYGAKEIGQVFEFVRENVSLDILKRSLTNDEAQQGIAELEEVVSSLQKLGFANIDFDVSLARGQAYYTGTVIEVYLKDKSIASSVAAGGRYDTMIGSFVGSGREIPAVGISFGLEPIVDVLKMRRKELVKTKAKVLVLPINTALEALKTVRALREAGIATDLALLKGVTKNLQYAAALGIPYVLILGENELKQKKVLLRDMTSGVEQLLPLRDGIKKLR
ncbi:histidine--tRNA ligase [Candidatus Woesearchaeota archaeon]|nr:histidine--tRNA ligase [Candidatus Woesearchaeota archaeon]